MERWLNPWRLAGDEDEGGSEAAWARNKARAAQMCPLNCNSERANQGGGSWSFRGRELDSSRVVVQQ